MIAEKQIKLMSHVARFINIDKQKECESIIMDALTNSIEEVS
jgi:hypothetical protein